jgi:formylglycine-generating enzyme required for sulfatase activity
MIKTVLISCLTSVLYLFIISCNNKSNITPIDYPDPIKPDTLSVPKNIRVNSLKISYNSLFNSVSNTYDTATYASFQAMWDSVYDASYYVVMVFTGESGSEILFKDFTCSLTQKTVDSLEPNKRYSVKIRAMKVKDTVINGINTPQVISGNIPDTFAVAYLYQPLPPENISVSYSGLNARITWSHRPNRQITGYRIYRRNPKGIIIDSLSTDSTATSAYFPILLDSTFKFNIRTIDTVGFGMLCSTYIYDVSAGKDNSFRLPYVYLSTYSEPQPLTLDTNAGEMIGVRGGIFARGNIWADPFSRQGGKEEGIPVHEVVLSSFYLGKNEITNNQYAAFLNDVDIIRYESAVTFRGSASIDITVSADTAVYLLMGTDTMVYTRDRHLWHIACKYDSTLADTVFVVDSGFENYPVGCIYWKGAAAFCNWLTSKNGTLSKCYDTSWNYIPNSNGYRLPSEAEFEYVQSGAFAYPGTKQRFPWGYKLDTLKFGSKQTGLGITGRSFNTYSIFNDLSGNIAEWCNDWSDLDTNYYEQCLRDTVTFNPFGPPKPSVPLTNHHIIRGGSYMRDVLEVASNRRVIDRYKETVLSFSDCGFRIARSAN